MLAGLLGAIRGTRVMREFKSEGQIKAKVSCVKNRQHAPQKFLYEIAALDSQT